MLLPATTSYNSAPFEAGISHPTYEVAGFAMISPSTAKQLWNQAIQNTAGISPSIRSEELEDKAGLVWNQDSRQ